MLVAPVQPKMRGASLPKMWGRLVRLVRSPPFAGHHLLVPTEGRVEINARMLVELIGGARRAGGNGGGSVGDMEADGDRESDAGDDYDDDDEVDFDDFDDGDDGDNHGQHGQQEGDRDANHPIDPATAMAAAALVNGVGDTLGQGSTSADGCGSGTGRARARASVDVEGYLTTLAWCAHMYLSGTCVDYSISYSARSAPSASQLAAHVMRMESEAAGEPYRPGFATPPSGSSGLPLTPDIFALCLLPAAAAPYLPAHLRGCMDAAAPLADIFHANEVWPLVC